MIRGKTKLPILMTDARVLVVVELEWWYTPEIPPSPENDFGEPYDFTYDILNHNAPEGITEEMLMDEIDKISIFDIMDRDF